MTRRAGKIFPTALVIQSFCSVLQPFLWHVYKISKFIDSEFLWYAAPNNVIYTNALFVFIKPSDLSLKMFSCKAELVLFNPRAIFMANLKTMRILLANSEEYIIPTNILKKNSNLKSCYFVFLQFDEKQRRFFFRKTNFTF